MVCVYRLLNKSRVFLMIFEFDDFLGSSATLHVSLTSTFEGDPPHFRRSSLFIPAFAGRVHVCGGLLGVFKPKFKCFFPIFIFESSRTRSNRFQLEFLIYNYCEIILNSKYLISYYYFYWIYDLKS